MLRGIEGLLAEKSSLKVEGLSQHQVDRMLKLAKLPAMKNLPQKIQGNAVRSCIVCSGTFSWQAHVVQTSIETLYAVNIFVLC